MNTQTQQNNLDDDLRPEYEFDYSKAVRGKHIHALLAEGANVVVLEPDVAQSFPDSASVNAALRSLLKLMRSTQRLTKRRRSKGQSASRAARSRSGRNRSATRSS